MRELKIVGPAEVASLANVNPATVRSWQLRGHLPPPDATLATGAVWRRSTIERWLKGAGRKRVALLQELGA